MSFCCLRFGVVATEDKLVIYGSFGVRKITWEEIVSIRAITVRNGYANAEVLLKNGKTVKLFCAPIKNKFGVETELNTRMEDTLNSIRLERIRSSSIQ